MNNNIRAAIIPGSFDPITVGHLDLIERCANIFETVYINVFSNSEKSSGMFTAEEKLDMLKLATKHLPNVICSADNGMTALFAEEKQAVIVKGVRNVADFDYEIGMFWMNRAIASAETLFLPAKQEYLHISSTFVRELIKYGRDFSNVVPKPVCQYLKTKIDRDIKKML